MASRGGSRSKGQGRDHVIDDGVTREGGGKKKIREVARVQLVGDG